MIQVKYLIVIGAILSLIIVYYLYSEISNVKKMLLPTYRKTMELESRISTQEKLLKPNLKDDSTAASKLNSPVFSISYKSDMVKNGNLSVKYVDLSETEAKELLNNIDKNNSREIRAPHPIRHDRYALPEGDFTDYKPQQSRIHSDIFAESETNTVNLRAPNVFTKTNTDERSYRKILDGLAAAPTNFSESCFNSGTELDQDVIKSITESIQRADMPSDTVLSEISDRPNLKSKTNALSKK